MCNCALPHEVQHVAEEVACPRAGPQEKPAPLQEDWASSSTGSPGGVVGPMSPTPCSEESSPRSHDLVSAEPPCDSDPAAFGLPANSPGAARPPTSAAGRARTPLAMTAARP